MFLAARCPRPHGEILQRVPEPLGQQLDWREPLCGASARIDPSFRKLGLEGLKVLGNQQNLET